MPTETYRESIEQLWEHVENNCPQTTETIYSYYNTFLKDKGVKLPSCDTQNWFILKCLATGYPSTSVWGKGVLQKIYNKFSGKKETNDMQSQRHLSNCQGWDIKKGNDIIPKNLSIVLEEEELYLTKESRDFLGVSGVMKEGYYYLASLENTYPGWRDKRRNIINKNGEVIKPSCCQSASCGAREGETHPKLGTITKLEMGHRDPFKPPIGDNIIWQCTYCNQIGQYVTYDIDGNVNGLSSKKLFMNSSFEVQKECVHYFLTKNRDFFRTFFQNNC